MSFVELLDHFNEKVKRKIFSLLLMKTLILKDTYTPIFIAILFIIAKTWKQPKCPSMDEWTKKM